MRARATIALAVALVLAVALMLAGCGDSSLSASQLRTGAARVCVLAQRRTGRLPAPSAPSGESAYLRGGVAALAPELTALRGLHPPHDMDGTYHEAVDAVAAELGALRSTLKDLKAGNDPVVAIKALQQKLSRPEGRSQSAWESLAIPACISS